MWGPADHGFELGHIGLQVVSFHGPDLGGIGFDRDRLAAEHTKHFDHFMHRSSLAGRDVGGRHTRLSGLDHGDDGLGGLGHRNEVALGEEVAKSQRLVRVGAELLEDFRQDVRVCLVRAVEVEEPTDHEGDVRKSPR